MIYKSFLQIPEELKNWRDQVYLKAELWNRATKNGNLYKELSKP